MLRILYVNLTFVDAFYDLLYRNYYITTLCRFF